MDKTRRHNKRGALSVKRNLEAAKRLLARYKGDLAEADRTDWTPGMQELINAHEMGRAHGEPRLM